VSVRPGGRTGARSSARRAIRAASEQVAVEIQHYIQEEGLGPDDFLGREEDLAAEFGVSRPTLREALRLLASGNLIRASKGPGGGIFVARTAEEGMSRSLSDAIAMMLETGTVTLDELLDARLLLEVPLAGLAAYQPDDQTIARLREIVAREASADPDDRDAFATSDMEIHRTLAAAGGNRMIQALTDWIFEVLQPSLVEVLEPAIVKSAILEHHQALLAAVERGDPARAERTMKDHLLYLQDVLRMVGEHSDGAPPGATADE
jgi:GntR family transcriptional regulator, transcriptional repressor for pyruvate dehydrogenase complex